MPGELTTVLGLVVALVVGFVWGRAYGSRQARVARNGTQTVYECTCGEARYDETEAKRHAVETHNAPPQDGEWLFLFDIRDREVG